MPPYRHSQNGYRIAGVIAAAVMGLLLAWGQARRPGWIVLAVFLGAAAFFSRLTTEVADGAPQVAFRPGRPRWQWPLREIASAGRVRNPWYAGWASTGSLDVQATGS